MVVCYNIISEYSSTVYYVLCNSFNNWEMKGDNDQVLSLVGEVAWKEKADFRWWRISYILGPGPKFLPSGMAITTHLTIKGEHCYSMTYTPWEQFKVSASKSRKRGMQTLPRNQHPTFLLMHKLPYLLQIWVDKILNIHLLLSFRTITWEGSLTAYLLVFGVGLPFRSVALILWSWSTTKIKEVCY